MKKLTAKEQAFRDMKKSASRFSKLNREVLNCKYENPGLKFGIRLDN